MISKKDEKAIRKMLSLAVDPEQALTYDELCGLIFGLAITPDVILPSEWLPLVFGEEMITVDSEEEGIQLINTLLAVVNDFTDRFHNEDLVFPFSNNYLAHKEDLEVVQEWTWGLNAALSLRPECWYDMTPEAMDGEDGDELMNSLSVIHGIAEPEVVEELFETRVDEEGDQLERMLASLFILLPVSIDTLLDYAFFLEEERRAGWPHRSEFHPTVRREEPKIGRNDPCTCGSGKKHKKCCLRKEKIVPIR